MHLPRLSISGASVLLGVIGCSNLVYAGCGAGYVAIDFTGKGVTNTIADAFSLLPASLGSLTLKSKRPSNIKLECGVRGVVTSEPVPGYDPTFDPPYVVTTTFTSYIVCGDHTEAVVDSVATLQPDLVGYCASSPDTYDPSSPINGRFEEPGTIVGKWGLLKDATGTFNVSGTSSCGLQEWDVEATVCVNENLVKQH